MIEMLSMLAGSALLGLALYLALRMTEPEDEGRISSMGVSRRWLDLSDYERKEMQQRVVERMRGAA